MSSKSNSRNYAGLSQEERTQLRKESFLDAGLEVFGTLGLRGAKVRLLCREAKLTERYFYESFASVEALFCAVFERETIKLQEFFVEKLPQLPDELEQRVPAALDFYFKAMRDQRTVRVLYLESLVGSDDVVEMHNNNIRQFATLASQFIRIDNPDINLPDKVLVHIALGINGAISALAVQWMLENYKTPRKTIVQSASVLVKGIISELRAS